MFPNAQKRKRLVDAIFGGIVGFGAGCIIYEFNVISLDHEVEHLIERLPELAPETAHKLSTIIIEDNMYSYEKWGTALGMVLGGCFGIGHNWLSPLGFACGGLITIWLNAVQHTKCEIHHDNVASMGTMGLVIMIGGLYFHR